MRWSVNSTPSVRVGAAVKIGKIWHSFLNFIWGGYEKDQEVDERDRISPETFTSSLRVGAVVKIDKWWHLVLNFIWGSAWERPWSSWTV